MGSREGRTSAGRAGGREGRQEAEQEGEQARQQAELANFGLSSMCIQELQISFRGEMQDMDLLTVCPLRYVIYPAVHV